jgi:hypothetical protein
VLVHRQRATQVAHRRGLADAGLADDDADAGLGGEPVEDAGEAPEVRALVEGGLADGAARGGLHAEAFAPAHGRSSSSLRSSM